MPEKGIKRYYTFNTEGYPYELIFGHFNYQHIPPDYYDFLNDDDDNDNNITVTPVEYVFPDNEVVDDAIGPNSPVTDSNHEDIEH